VGSSGILKTTSRPDVDAIGTMAFVFAKPVPSEIGIKVSTLRSPVSSKIGVLSKRKCATTSISA
jgi:hypothetical protein